MQFAGVEKRCGPREFLTFDRVEMLCATRSCFVNGRPSGLAQLILESLLKIIAKVIARRRGDLELFIFFFYSRIVVCSACIFPPPFQWISKLTVSIMHDSRSFARSDTMKTRAERKENVSSAVSVF